MTFYGVLYKLFAWFFRWIFRVQVKGEENIPSDGAVMVCTNHISAFDPFIIIVSNTRQIFFMGKKELFKIPVLKQISKGVGVFPVERGANDVGAIKQAIKLLESGKIFGIFPQGTRHSGEDPHKTQIKSGVGLIEEKTGAPVLPCCIITKDNRIKPFRPVTIVYGEVIEPSEFSDILNDETLKSKEKHKKISETVFNKILELIDGEANER